MARYTSQLAAEAIGNRYEMALIATVRARELLKGHAPKLLTTDGPVVTALREIESGLIGREYMSKVAKPRK